MISTGVGASVGELKDRCNSQPSHPCTPNARTFASAACADANSAWGAVIILRVHADLRAPGVIPTALQLMARLWSFAQVSAACNSS